MDDKYYWIRVFDYVHERDLSYENESFGKGVLLDEFYLKGVNLSRDDVKNTVRVKYSGDTSASILFAKPKKKDGTYAIVMESSKFYYDRFYTTVDTFCFWHKCHKSIKGRVSEFPSVSLNLEEKVYFCSYDCKRHYYSILNPFNEGEFQLKEEGCGGNIFGYIYLIYNRVQNVYYVGQTRFMPFFRWQEHAKDGRKGDIKDLSFSILTEVCRNKDQSDEQNQQYLNSIEAWWIAKYQEEGYEVFNITNPKITTEYLKEKFNEMILKNQQLNLIV